MNGIIGKYRKSNNLFDKNNPDVYFNTTIVLNESVWRSYGGNARVVRIPCEINTTYTISIDSNITTGVFRVMLISTNRIPVEGNDVTGDLKISETYNVGQYTFTTSSNTKYVLFQTAILSYEAIIESLMFNKGSIALPYEPFGDIWDDMRCYKYGLLTDVFYAFPKQIIGDGNNIPSANLLNPEGMVVVDGTTHNGQSFPAGTYYIFNGAEDIVQNYITYSEDFSSKIYGLHGGGATFFTTTNSFILFARNKDILEVSMVAKSSTAVPFTPYTGEYTIKGNMIQTGTPTPSAPIYPSECGDRTNNLYNEKIENAFISTTGTIETNINYDIAIIPVTANEYYSFAYKEDYAQNYVVAYYTSKPTVGSTSYNSSRTIYYYSESPQVSVIIPTGITYIAIRMPKNGSIVFNTGSTPLPYEPYGYKIPFSLNNVEYPIYLSEPIRKYDDYVDILSSNGNVSRKIKKLVLDGTEGWERTGTSQSTYYRIQISSSVNTYVADKIICSHCGYTNITTTTTGSGCDVINSASQVDYLAFRLLDIAPNESLFKTYLANQYANGTPVTVYIFYSNPVTEQITIPMIPTTGSSETFNVTTTLKPSEVDLSYHGWHKCRDIHKYKIIDRVLTNLPDTIIGDGNDLDSYTIKGNMIQNGTPSTSNPVYPQECGDRTSNLISNIVQGGVTSADGQVTTSTNRVRTTPIYVNPGETYTANGGNLRVATYVYYKDGVYNSGAFIDQIGITIKIPNNVNQIIIGFKNFEGTDITPEDAQNVMFNKGSSVLPYEPYGYKLPVVSGGVTTNIYLLEPLRKIGDYADTITVDGVVSIIIKKLVLTGEEDWQYVEAYTSSYFRITIGEYRSVISNYCICSHFNQTSITTSTTNVGFNVGNAASIQGAYVVFRPNNVEAMNAETFKAYLAAQYSAGTPVTIWYVLATPTTETFTPHAIPTTGTSETFDVTTTLKPSEVDLSYHSWYDIYPYGTIGYLQTTYTIGQMQQYPIDELQGGD